MIRHQKQVSTPYGGCHCPCHYSKGIKHCVPCCKPSDDNHKPDWHAATHEALFMALIPGWKAEAK